MLMHLENVSSASKFLTVCTERLATKTEVNETTVAMVKPSYTQQ